MKGFVTTNKFLEKISELEIKEFLNNIKCDVFDSVVVFDIKSYDELALITYKAQSINRACILLNMINLNEINDINKIDEEIEKIKLENIKELIKNKSFRVECERIGKHDFKSTDIEMIVGKKLNELLKKNNMFNKVDYNNPEIIFYFFINQDKGYFGLDFSGFDLSKRQYKIFNHPESLKGNVAYSLIRLSGFNKLNYLVDPFMGSGTIVIEAGLYATDFPVQYYNKDKLSFTRLIDSKKIFHKIDKIIKREKKTNIYGYDYQIKYLKASQKNAKLAGVDKSINLSKCEIEWLDTKFEKNSIDLIITDPPRYSKHKEKELSKLYKELFYQSEYILKKEGKLVLLIKDNEVLKKASENNNFKIINKYSIFQGMEMFEVIVFEKIKKVIS